MAEREKISDIHSEEEKEHFYKIICSFRSYKLFSKSLINRRIRYLNSLPERQQKMLSTYRERMEEVLKCIDHNSKVIKLIIQDVEKLFENIQHSFEPGQGLTKRLTVSDVDKVHVTLKQIYRDWSEEGATEREKCYKPIIEEIERCFPKDISDRGEVKVLVPGAGLGRLAFEVARRGFTCQGNEFSFFMLFASNFILNRCSGVNLHEIYPWVHQQDNVLRSEDQLFKVRFPDTDPSDLYRLFGTSRFSMAAGDFLEVYTERNEWDCVATCFFIDCANNICEFIEHIFNILKPGGMWVSLGPLQYHFSTSLDEDSIEPTFEEIRQMAEDVGFVIQKVETGITTGYSQQPSSMLKNVYECVFLCCTKPSATVNNLFDAEMAAT